MLILGGAPIRATMVADAQRIAAATGAKLTAAQFNARVERGRGRHPIPRLPYGIDQAMAAMASAQHIVLIGTTPPVAPFAYPDKPGYLAPAAATTHVLARPEQDVADAPPGSRTSWARLTSPRRSTGVSTCRRKPRSRRRTSRRCWRRCCPRTRW